MSPIKVKLIKTADSMVRRFGGPGGLRRLSESRMPGTVPWALTEARKCMSPAWDDVTTDEWCESILSVLGELS